MAALLAWLPAPQGRLCVQAPLQALLFLCSCTALPPGWTWGTALQASAISTSQADEWQGAAAVCLQASNVRLCSPLPA